MVDIIKGELIRNETNQNAMGGTELIAERISKRVNKDLLEKFQLINSRPRSLREDLKKVLICHDLAQDPEMTKDLSDGGWKKYDRIVCVSYWQRQQYKDYLGVPLGHMSVVYNGIDPLPYHIKHNDGKVNLIYHSTPHRGLIILEKIFSDLCKEYDFLHLDVFSSFNLYGWPQRDEQFKDLFKKLEDNPNVTYHGTVSNKDVRNALTKADIFAYPSIWQETSCLCLIESMSANLACVHPDYGALPETAKMQTNMYPFSEDINAHAFYFKNELENVIFDVKEDKENNNSRVFRDTMMKDIIDDSHSWDVVKYKWENLLESLL